MRIQEYPRAKEVDTDAVLLIDGTEKGTQSIEMDKIVEYVQENIEFPEPTPEFDLGILDSVPSAAVTDDAKLLIKPTGVEQAAITVKNFLTKIFESATLTGEATADTPEATDNSQRIATTEYVKTLIGNLIDGAPETLDTLKEISDALYENEDVVSALNELVAKKVDEGTFEEYKKQFSTEVTEAFDYLMKQISDLKESKPDNEEFQEFQNLVEAVLYFEHMDQYDPENPIDFESDPLIRVGTTQTTDSFGDPVYQNTAVPFSVLKEQLGGGKADGVDFNHLPTATSIEGNDQLLLGVEEETGIQNYKTNLEAILGYLQDNIDISKLPKGTKILTKQFTVNNPATMLYNICNISDFGVSDVNDVKDFFVRVNRDTPWDTWYSLDGMGNIVASYYKTMTSTTLLYTVSLIVKDYSEIGSEIVTENVKMITKTTTATFNNAATAVCFNLSDLNADISSDDVVGLSAVGLTSGRSFSAYLVNDSIRIIFIANTPISGTEKVNISLFVRVPVVERLPRFTKDITVTLPVNGSAVKILTLDGSDECGGYTKDTISSISTIGIGPQMWASNVLLNNDNSLYIYNTDKIPSAATGVVRLTIE